MPLSNESTAGDGGMALQTLKFYTKDNDNNDNCASKKRSAWWHGDHSGSTTCPGSVLTSNSKDGIYWSTLSGVTQLMKAVLRIMPRVPKTYCKYKG